MPPKAEPRDWDRLFRPNAPRRGGPLRALINVLLLAVGLGVIVGGGGFAIRFGLERAHVSATATAQAVATSNAIVLAARTARALTATPLLTPTPAEAVLRQGSVVAAGNLRSEPIVSNETVLGLLCPGDQVNVFEERTAADGALWYRVRLTQRAADCSEQHVQHGTLGWASSTLLAP